MEPPQLLVLPKRPDPLRSGLLFGDGDAASAAGQPSPLETGAGVGAFRSPAPRVPLPPVSAGPLLHASRSTPGSGMNTGPLTHFSGSGPLLVHPFSAASFAEAAAFNRSEVAERIRRSFDAMVARSPIGGHLVSRSRTGPGY